MIVAGVIYFVIVLPLTKLAALRGVGDETESPAPSDETKLLTEIRDLLAADRA